MENIFCKELYHLPKIPDKFLKFILQCPMTMETYPNPRKPVGTKNGVVVKKCTHKFKPIEESELSEWIKYNVTKPLNINLNWIITTLSNGQVMLPHTDKRSLSFKYFIKLGGLNVKTTWYKQENYSYDNLIPLYSVVVKLHTWYVFNGKIVHGLENLEDSRVSLSGAWLQNRGTQKK